MPVQIKIDFSGSLHRPVNGYPLLLRADREIVQKLAAALMREAADRMPSHPFIADLFSTAPESLRNAELALSIARRAIEEKPKDWQRRQSQAWALFRSGDWHGCLEQIELPELRKTQECNFVGAMALWHLGRHEDARRLLARGQEWLPTYLGADQNDPLIHPPASMLARLKAEAEQLLAESPNDIQSGVLTTDIASEAKSQ